ncbi:MocR-like transcription factor YczR [Mycobacteroides abscessus]|uniref:MocR-like transcription factor YczR n=1 Tax=Mycobacteroides abscessus TaxID=36809 RepID=UPI000C260FF2|nr:PLP-dependent aminotransferase family protein [Mycobacteroides abscessus]
MPDRVVTAETLARHLGQWRTTGSAGPAYGALADAIRLLVIDGRLPLGVRIPSERALASALHVSRTTVTTAYAELRESGYLRGRQGARSTTALPGPDRTGSATTGLMSPMVDLQNAATAAPAAAVLEAYQAALTTLPTHLRGIGHELVGVPELRPRIAEHFSRRGLPTTEDQIMVTCGAQQAIALLLGAFVEPGDRVLVEQPTYHGALDAISQRGARPVPVPMHTHERASGWDMTGMETTIRQTAPNLAYLVLDNHNPTGLTMPLGQRKALADIISQTRTRTVVDESLVGVWHQNHTPAPMAALVSRPELVVTIGSMSKSFWGGMRVGWIRADRTTIARLAAVRSAMDTGTPILEQLAAAELLERAEEVEAAQRETLRARRALVVSELHRRLPEWELQEADGGLCIWARLPAPMSTALAAAAARLGVRIAAGPRFGVGGSLERFVRVPFTQHDDQLLRGVELLAQAWHTVTGALPLADSTMVG